MADLSSASLTSGFYYGGRLFYPLMWNRWNPDGMDGRSFPAIRNVEASFRGEFL